MPRFEYRDPARLHDQRRGSRRGPGASCVADGADLVIAIGGDGTVREVAEALAGTDVRLGIIALGTGNVLASNLGPDC